MDQAVGKPSVEQVREFRLHLMESAAALAGKEVWDLEPWLDYEPIAVDNAVFNFANSRSGVRYAGD